MTQLSLFESATATTVAPRHTSRSTHRRPSASASLPAEIGSNVDIDDVVRAEPEEGLNRIGDLARYLILRHDLAAKRRREMQARRRASGRVS